MPSTPLTRLRAICLRFPEVHEVEAWGEPTFRVRNKMFAMYAHAETHHGRGHPAVWCKGTLFDQDLLVRANPRRPDWDVVREVLSTAYLRTAPKKLATQVSGKPR